MGGEKSKKRERKRKRKQTPKTYKEDQSGEREVGGQREEENFMCDKMQFKGSGTRSLESVSSQRTV